MKDKKDKLNDSETNNIIFIILLVVLIGNILIIFFFLPGIYKETEIILQSNQNLYPSTAVFLLQAVPIIFMLGVLIIIIVAMYKNRKQAKEYKLNEGKK